MQSLTGLRILIVDDDLDALALMETLFQLYDARVKTADSVDAALACFRREPFDILVSDIGMPERDGHELIREIRATGARLPAIAVTAFTSAEERARTAASGFDRHLKKPVDVDLLLESVSSLGRPS